MNGIDETWSKVTAHMRELAVLGGINATLAWDQQVYMPHHSGASKVEQMGMVAGLLHGRMTDPRVGEWLSSLEGHDLEPRMAAGVANLRRAYDRDTRVPEALAIRASELEAKGFGIWHKARETDDFDSFAPVLDEILDCVRERAACIDPHAHPYDVMLEAFDPGTRLVDLRPMFSRLRDGLVDLLGALRETEQLDPLTASMPSANQLAVHEIVARKMGFDFDKGRMDLAAHPFTTRPGFDDIRITTRIMETDLLTGLGGTVHEVGHALYEQGLPYEHVGSGTEAACGMGVHESQSRFWENFIGRSMPFFRWLEPHLDLPGVTAADLFRGANRVQPGLIRVDADEVTYNLHIMVRFELEVMLIEGKLKAADLPDAWNQRYEEFLGLRPTSNADGVLQDVHWSGGALGYFPSYTLGNLYAASLGATLEAEYDDLWKDVENGNFAPTLDWLRDKVHCHGHTLDGAERIAAAVGDRDGVTDLLDYLWGRHGHLYGAKRTR